jgi:nucleotide-binding universal stress UspA family protein
MADDLINPYTLEGSIILLAFDGSAHARAAIELVSELPLARCDQPENVAQVLVVAVMPSQHITGHEQMQADLQRACQMLQEKGLKAACQLKAGAPANTIHNLAEEVNAELIVIGARGLRATLGILLGGVAQQVVEYARRPVLVVRQPYQGLNKVLFVTDGSEYSQQALDYLAGGPAGQDCPILPHNIQMHVLHVLPPNIPPLAANRAWTIGPEVIYPATPFDQENLEQEEEAQGNKILAETEAKLRQHGIIPVLALERGDAATQILEYAQREKIDLIVCGTRGWGSLSGWLMGSVTRKLVHYAPCSVLVVK